jgi:hypothetical protein
MHEGSESGEERSKLVAGDRLQLGDRSWGTGDAVPESRFVHSYLAAVAQSEHLNLLLGSGLTTALTVASDAAPEISMSAQLSTGDAELDAKIESAAIESSSASARGGVPNIEDRLRVAIAMLVPEFGHLCGILSSKSL